ncbi:hypothetical protein [Acetoanaerobium pronyense]|uniref:hypothetical protein n=1 Tax=Acetoanaerobium pronyense TaxID=1482736 RepID=UPI001AE8ADB0|nr:hypothetical protein [Acetoanaerobium pronyense]
MVFTTIFLFGCSESASKVEDDIILEDDNLALSVLFRNVEVENDTVINRLTFKGNVVNRNFKDIEGYGLLTTYGKDGRALETIFFELPELDRSSFGNFEVYAKNEDVEDYELEIFEVSERKKNQRIPSLENVNQSIEFSDDITVSSSVGSLYTVMGRYTNKNSTPVSGMARITFFDSDGRIIDSSPFLLSRIEPNQTKTFSTHGMEIEGYKTYEIQIDSIREEN